MDIDIFIILGVIAAIGVFVLLLSLGSDSKEERTYLKWLRKHNKDVDKKEKK